MAKKKIDRNKPKVKKPSVKQNEVLPKKKFSWIYVIISLILIGILGWNLLEKEEKTSTKNLVVGPANLCKHSPALITKYGLQQPVMIDFRQKGFTGMRIIEAKAGGKVLQLPSWDDAGHLGPYALDRKGNVYTTPIPHVSFSNEELKIQNKIYQIDSNTGEMAEFIDLPAMKPPSTNNPFGAMGIAYDCDTESIYITSLTGSNASEEIGRLFQVDLATKKVVNIFEGIDAIGVGVFTTKKGKKIYYGSAREPDIYSINLDGKGNFVGAPQFEFSLVEQEGGSFDKGHRIRFFKDNRIEIKGIEFSYSLMVASDPLRNIYNFKYDENADTWTFLEVHKQ